MRARLVGQPDHGGPSDEEKEAMEIALAMLVLLLSAWVPAGAAAQTSGAATGAERERAFVEALRRDDPAAADRYVALRDARTQAMADLREAEQRYSAAGAELRPVMIDQLKKAQRAYAERSLALLDFLDARDRRALAAAQEQVQQIQHALDDNKQRRAELEKLLE